MRNLILIGSGGHSRPVISTIQINKKFNLVGIIDLEFNNKIKENILGIPIVGPISFLEKTNYLDTSIFLAIGDNNLRKSLSENHVIKKFELINVIKIFNSVLKTMSFEKGYGFLDLQKLTDRGDGFSNEIWHLDAIHISPQGMQKAWSEYKIKLC